MASDGNAALTRPIAIASPQLAAEISPMGAELSALRDAEGRDLLWDGDPAWWTGRSPLLFPVIGLLEGGGYNLDGQRYTMPKHGFARHSLFQVAAIAPEMIAFRLADTPDTRALWPFGFLLDLVYTVEGASLKIEASITNSGTAPMPASFGFHPAFRWPLPYGAERSAHRLVTDTPEPEPIRRVGPDGLLLPEPRPTPFEGDILVPRDALFEEDAVILDAVRSRSITYGAPGTPEIRVDFEGLPVLACWTKPGAPFLCIEPWAGLPDPVGFAGDIRDKPGVTLIAPDETSRFAITITLLPAAAE